MSSKLIDRLGVAAAEVIAAGDDFDALDGPTVLSSLSRLSDLSTIVETLTAKAAGAVSLLSARQLGHDGLAAQHGFRSPEKLVQSVTRSTAAEATRLVQVGTMMTNASLDPLPAVTGEVDDAGCPIPRVDENGHPILEPFDPNPTPWLVPVAAAVAAGHLPAAGAEAIRRGLGPLSDSVTVEQLLAGAEQLLTLAGRVDADALFKRARQARDEIDAAGVADRERAQHEARSFTMWQRADGMVAGRFQYAPEDGAFLMSMLGSVMSPRRGGPRFVDESSRAAAQALVDDPRTNEQLQADAFLAALRLAADADPGTMFGQRHPSVKVIVTREALESRDHANSRPTTPDTAFGRIEGSHEAVSLDTIERQLCDAGSLGITFGGDGQALDLGREARLFSRRQREVLAVRDGGCIGSEDCAMPPAMCEAHHINPWRREAGRTDVADGVLLCRFHHLNLHNNGHRIARRGGRYWLIAAPRIGPEQRHPERRHPEHADSMAVLLVSNNPDFRRRDAS